jgi:serine/threonine protein kinase
MLEVTRIPDNLDNLYYMGNEGFESTIFISEYDTITKFFKPHVSDKMLFRKEAILIALHFSEIYNKHKIIPEIYNLICKNDGNFIGYTMGSVVGKKLDEFCENISITDSLILFKNLQEAIKIVNDNGFCLTDFNPSNILVSRELNINLVDIDSFCLINDSSKDMFCYYKHICSFTRIFDVKYNIYSFYSLFIDIVLKVNRRENSKKEILQKIIKEDLLTDSIKEKLVYFLDMHSKKQLVNLDYLFD